LYREKKKRGRKKRSEAKDSTLSKLWASRESMSPNRGAHSGMIRLERVPRVGISRKNAYLQKFFIYKKEVYINIK